MPAPGQSKGEHMQLIQTISPSGAKRYFIEGKRTTRERYELAQLWRRLECFRTTITRGTIRHYVCAR